MADTKLSALTALAVEMADTDEIYVNDGGVSKRQAYSVLKAAFATAAQGTLAASATQPGDDAADLGSGAASDGHVLTADGAGGAAWEAAGAGSGDFKADGTVDMTGEFRTDVGTFDSDVANGASAVAFSYDTANAYSTAGAKLANWKNNGTESIYFDKDGGACFNSHTTRKQLLLTSDGNDPVITNAAGGTHLFIKLRNGAAGYPTLQFSSGSDAFGARGLRIYNDTNKALALSELGIATQLYDADFVVQGHTRIVDEARRALIIRGGPQYTSATTNLVGGALQLTGGAGASASAGNAHGGNVTISGGTGYGTGHKGYIILDLNSLPTADPTVNGALWLNSGVLEVSGA